MAVYHVVIEVAGVSPVFERQCELCEMFCVTCVTCVCPPPW